MHLFENVYNLSEGAEFLRRRAHGVIEARGGEFYRIRLRPFPTLVSIGEILVRGRLIHAYRRADRCLLYYDQPRRFPNFLAVKYVISTRGTSYQTFLRTLQALDEVARIKGSDALLCELATWRIGREMMDRWGWQPHCDSRWRRHYIKRFYGVYPPRAEWIERQTS